MQAARIPAGIFIYIGGNIYIYRIYTHLHTPCRQDVPPLYTYLFIYLYFFKFLYIQYIRRLRYKMEEEMEEEISKKKRETMPKKNHNSMALSRSESAINFKLTATRQGARCVQGARKIYIYIYI